MDMVNSITDGLSWRQPSSAYSMYYPSRLIGPFASASFRPFDSSILVAVAKYWIKPRAL